MNLLRTPQPSSSSVATYRDARRDTLNFELVGGERHAHSDLYSLPLNAIYDFLARAAKSVATRSN